MTPEELELQKAAKKSLASHFAKAASHHEKMADMHEKLADEHEEAAGIHEKADVGCKDCMGKSDTAKAARIETLKAEAVSKGEVYKEDVGSGADDSSTHEVLANQQEYHKAMGKCEMSKAAHHDKMAKAHDKMAEHCTKMAESHDEEAAKATKAEIAAFDLANPEVAPVAKAAPEPKVATMDDDVKAAAQAVRGSQAYKDAVASIAKAQVDAEVAKLRDSTLAPLGVTLDPETGAAIIKGLKVVPRDEKPGDFVFAGKGETGTHAGL